MMDNNINNNNNKQKSIELFKKELGRSIVHDDDIL